jgi:lauroyl/myristoyl acyltransferase
MVAAAESDIEMLYQAARKQLLERIASEHDLSGFYDQLTPAQWRIQIASANLQNFLPDVPLSKHEGILHKAFVSDIAATTIDIEFYRRFSVVTHQAEHLLKPMRQDRPVIICASHLGSFWHVQNAILDLGVSFMQAAPAYIGQAQRDKLLRMLRARRRTRGTPSNPAFHFVDMDNSFTRRAFHGLRDGAPLLVYFDGDAHLYEKRVAKQRVTIDFLNGRLQVSPGIAILAALSDAVLVPVTSKRIEPNKIEVMIYPAISAIKTPVRDVTSIRLIMQRLFDSIADTVRQHPEQWECWRYLHRFAVRNSTDEPALYSPDTTFITLLKFNSQRYVIFSDSFRCWLFDKTNYQVWPISAETYQWLKARYLHSADYLSPPTNVINHLIKIEAIG